MNMDQSAVAFNPVREDSGTAERVRMDAFRLGTSAPSATINHARKSSHARSHSRNTSISTSVSIPLSVSPTPSTTTNDSPPSSPTRSSLGASKRNSHHRRRSSVSTRRESADMMGVSLPAIPQSASDDNINLGDKDSIRRRALWALEGKTSVGTYSVEIPELGTPELAKRSFEFPSKPSYPPGVGAGFGGLNTLMGSKRDSLGKFMASTSTKEQLHTLMEEEEEEEDNAQFASPVQESANSPLEVVVNSPSPVPARHRPASLNLRPLSLASGTVIHPTNGDLPTPTLTPSPRPGLKSLTLPGLPSLSSGLSSNAATGPAASKRQSLILSSSPISTPGSSARKPPLSMSMDNSPPVPLQPTRRSSISYVSSGGTPPMPSYGLPTPEMTPTTDRRSSSGSVDMEIHHGRPLSATEQHFLFQAHQTLVQRITDLERALSHSRASSSRSRPVSCASSTSSVSSACEPSDEMLQLVADIKAERDELKKDVDGWRVRVGDLERQVSIFAKRVEVERRDAWVARERVGLLEVEKAKLQKTLEERDLQAREAQARFDSARQDAERATRACETLREEAVRMRDAEAECARLRAALQKEQARREEVERELEGAGLLATPRPFEPVVYPTPLSRTMMFARSRGLGFKSTDSESSFTDVDSLDGSREGMSAFGLKAVEEVEEDDSREDTLSNGSDDEDELARYEDEDECDVYMFHTSSSASSLGSAVDGFEHTTPRLSPEPAPALTASRSNSSSPTPLPSPIERSPAHARHASLSKVWTFPAATDSSPAFDREPEEIDRFFGCLEDVDNSPPLDSRLRSVESGKNLFAQALMEDDDELPPFVLPANVGEVVVSPEVEFEPKHVLDVVIEEDEDEEHRAEDKDTHENVMDDDEFVGEEDEGGIKFTFTPPPSFYEDTSAPDVPSMPVPTNSSVSESAGEAEDNSSLMFPQLHSPQRAPGYSSIPRFTPPKPSSLPVHVFSTSTPVKIPLVRSNSSSPCTFATPPPKRASIAPTFIPQPRGTAGSPFKTPTPPGSNKVASFIPQPRRITSPASARPSAIPVMNSTTNDSHLVSPRSRHVVTSEPPPAAPVMKSPTMLSPDPSISSPPSEFQPPPTPVSSPSLMSPTLASRLSFQTLTNLIPLPSLPWSPRASAVSTAAAAAAAMCFVPQSSSGSSIASDASPKEHGQVASAFVNKAVKATGSQSKARGFVPKQRQLDRLRVRLEEEQRLKIKGIVSVDCKNNQDGVLHI